MFSLVHALWFGAWVLINTGLLPGLPVFDPYPFSFLTLVVSLEAIFLALAVLNRQNRMSRDADRRGQLDLVVNLLAERESTVTMRMLERISEHLGVRVADLTEAELVDETDIERLLAELDAKIPAV